MHLIKGDAEAMFFPPLFFPPSFQIIDSFVSKERLLVIWRFLMEHFAFPLGIPFYLGGPGDSILFRAYSYQARRQVFPSLACLQLFSHSFCLNTTIVPDSIKILHGCQK